jgi:tetratricopeptide (TPR) repeat protein
VAGGKKDYDGMQQHLGTIQKLGGDGYEIRSILADLAEAKEDKKTMRTQLEAAYAFDPMQSEPLKGLFDLAKEEKRDADVIDILKRVAPLEQHDHDVWRMLLDRLVAAQQWDDVRKWGEGAVYVDVHRPGTHINYARGLIAGGDHARAIFELESALLCKSTKKDANKEQASAHALLAKELTAIGKKAEADAHRDQAKQLDPANDDLK